MSQERNYPTGPMLLTFLAGAAVGAVVVALTTPKSGSQLRGDLKDLARLPKRNARDFAAETRDTWDELKQRNAVAIEDLKQGVADAVKDLQA